MAVDKSVIGKDTQRSRVVVDRGGSMNFAKAVKDANPIYQDLRVAKEAGFDNLPVPPTFPFAWGGWGSFPEIQVDEPVKGNPMMELMGKLRQGGGMILHGEQEFIYHRTPQVGDVLKGEGKISDVYEKESKGRTMTFIVTDTVWSDVETGEPVVTARFNLIHRS